MDVVTIDSINIDETLEFINTTLYTTSYDMDINVKIIANDNNVMYFVVVYNNFVCCSSCSINDCSKP